MRRLATILRVTDDRRNTVPIARPLVRSAKNVCIRVREMAPPARQTAATRIRLQSALSIDYGPQVTTTSVQSNRMWSPNDNVCSPKRGVQLLSWHFTAITLLK